MCDSVHAVKKKKKGKYKVEEENTFYKDKITDDSYFFFIFLFNWLGEYPKKRHSGLFTHPPYAPKVKLLFLENDIPLFSLVGFGVFVHDSLLQSQSGLAQVKLIHSIILPLLLLRCAPYLSLI